MRHRMDGHECVRTPRPCVRDARLIGSKYTIGKRAIQPVSPTPLAGSLDFLRITDTRE